MLSDSSSITVPSLLHKHTRSRDPFLRRHYPASSVLWPLRLPDWPPSFLTTFGVATSDQPRASPTDPDHLPCMLCSLPRWTGTGACWFLPCPHGLPRFSGGSASTTSLSRPAQASHALRPARLLTHHSWALSRGSTLTSFPARTLASYQINQHLFEWVLPPLVIHAFGAH